MKDWVIKKLDDVCQLITCGVAAKPKYVENGIPFLSAKNVKEGQIIWRGFNCISEQTHKELTKNNKPLRGDILYTRVGSYGEAAVIENDFEFSVFVSLTLIKVDTSILNNYFLKYYLNSDFVKRLAKKSISSSGVGNLNVGTVRDFPILLPPIPEQKRIIVKLDEAFGVISKAKVSAEQNLKNAKELFDSYLQEVFEKRTKGWEEVPLENCFKLRSGDSLTSKNMNSDGKYQVFGGNGIAGLYDDFNLSGSNVIIGRVGALCGNVRHIAQDIWLTDNAFRVVDFMFEFDHAFLTYLLNFINLRSFARQAAQPVISNSSLKDVVLKFPKIKMEQQSIVQNLNSLSVEVKRLEAIYQQKINDLEELKKSILQKAFSGELTSKLKPELA